MDTDNCGYKNKNTVLRCSGILRSVDWRLSSFGDNLSHIQGPDMLFRNVDNYQSTLRNISEERRSHLHRGGSLKSRSCIRIRKI